MSKEPSHEALWAREGDAAREYWAKGEWGPFAAHRTPEERSEARRQLHGFDFRIESHNGTKTMVKICTSCGEPLESTTRRASFCSAYPHGHVPLLPPDLELLDPPA